MDQIYVVARFKIHPNRANEFKSAAAACLAATRSGEPGTLAYEWFMNEDESAAMVLEAYESSEAVFAHMKNSGPLIPKLMQWADPTSEGLGTPNAELRDRLEGRVRFVARFQGLDAPQLGDSGSGTDIRTVAHFRIHPGKLVEFKSAAAAGLRAVVDKDPGTSAYEWYLDESAGQCTVIEKYRDPDAVLAHAKNVGHHLRGLLQISDLSAELCTTGSASSLAALAKLPMKRYGYFQGLRS
jgi:quinol monooxygenase YgiN